MNSWLQALIALSTTASASSFAPSPAFVPTRANFAIKNLRRQDQMHKPLAFKTLPDAEVDLPFVSRTPEKLPHISPIQTNNKQTPPSPNDVTLSLLPSDDDDDNDNSTDEEGFKSYPLVITPKSDKDMSKEFLSAFVEQNRKWIDAMILRYGALLFRGFDIGSAQDVEDVLLSYEPNTLNNKYRGTSPRHTQGGTKYVFSAAEVPSHFPIAQHIEMSFLPGPPKKVFFSALKAPAARGGETALADFRKVYRDIPLKLREKLQTKKLRYTRTHKKVGERFTHDVAAMLSWSELFGTTNQSQVELLAAREGMPMRWDGHDHGDGNHRNDTFVSEFETEAFQRHPQSGEMVWFNHAQVFHWTSFPMELLAAFRRTGDVRYLIRSLIVGVFSYIKYGLLRRKMALHVAFGDGSPISIGEMHQIRKAVHKNTVYNRWEQGDIVMIDNYSTSHGRQPTYDKGRNIVVAWSEPLAVSETDNDVALANHDEE